MPVMEQQQIEWLTVEQIAKRLDEPEPTVRYWIQKKRLPAYKFGKKLKVKQEDLEKFIEQSRTDRE